MSLSEKSKKAKMELKSLTDKYDRIKKELTTELIRELNSSFTEFFTNNPNIYGFRWVQYTSRFNDDEACTFARHEIGVLETEEDLELRAYELKTHWDYSQESSAKNIADFIEALDNIPDEIYEEAFGDHAEITVLRSGIEVEEYSHD